MKLLIPLFSAAQLLLPTLSLAGELPSSSLGCIDQQQNLDRPGVEQITPNHVFTEPRYSSIGFHIIFTNTYFYSGSITIEKINMSHTQACLSENLNDGRLNWDELVKKYGVISIPYAFPWGTGKDIYGPNDGGFFRIKFDLLKAQPNLNIKYVIWPN